MISNEDDSRLELESEDLKGKKDVQKGATKRDKTCRESERCTGRAGITLRKERGGRDSRDSHDDDDNHNGSMESSNRPVTMHMLGNISIDKLRSFLQVVTRHITNCNEYDLSYQFLRPGNTIPTAYVLLRTGTNRWVQVAWGNCKSAHLFAF